MLDRLKIPPVAGYLTPKPGLPLDSIRIPTKLIPWPHAEGITPRISINSFGFGGANAHAILERWPRSSSLLNSSVSPCPRLYLFSANSQKSLSNTINSQRAWLEEHPDTGLADLSYTLCHRRTTMAWRFSCVAEDHISLLHELRHGPDALPAQPAPRESYVAFVFTGQGAQWVGMGHQLLTGSTPSPVFRDSIRASGKILRELGASWNLEAELLRDANTPTLLNNAEISQPATTALQR